MLKSKFYDYESNILDISTEDISYYFTLRRNVVQVKGDSATGKSLLVEIIGQYKERDRINKKNYAGNIFIVKELSDILDLKHKYDFKKCLIIVDNAEFLLSEKGAVDIIRNDVYNQYIIMSRITCGVCNSPNNYATLKRDGKTIELKYMINEKGW